MTKSKTYNIIYIIYYTVKHLRINVLAEKYIDLLLFLTIHDIFIEKCYELKLKKEK